VFLLLYNRSRVLLLIVLRTGFLEDGVSTGVQSDACLDLLHVNVSNITKATISISSSI